MKEVFLKVTKETIRVPKNSNREHKVMTLVEAKQLASTGKKIFIKPFDIKLFTGFVLDQMIYTSIKNIPDQTQVMVYDVFSSPIKSEWRCYVLNNKVIDIRNYSGDFFTVPSESYLESVIKSNIGFPKAYTIDIGVLEDGKNEVIEYNDMWGIGNYGIPNNDYLRLLECRYFEIVSK